MKKVLSVLKFCMVKPSEKRGGGYILEKDICNLIADRELVPDYIYCSSHDRIKVNEINV